MSKASLLFFIFLPSNAMEGNTNHAGRTDGLTVKQWADWCNDLYASAQEWDGTHQGIILKRNAEEIGLMLELFGFLFNPPYYTGE